MTAKIVSDPARLTTLLARDARTTLEALDEYCLAEASAVSAWECDDGCDDNFLVVRWGQGELGRVSLAMLSATRLSGLDDLVAALPLDRGPLDLLLPFWAAAALPPELGARPTGACARYAVERGRLARSPVAQHCLSLGDHGIASPVFPKIVRDAPAYALSVAGDLAAVAVVTHMRAGIARLATYTTPDARGRGFGRGVFTALSSQLLDLGVLPTVAVDLGDERSVRMVERAGYGQHMAHLAVRIERRVSTRDDGLVQLETPRVRTG